MTHDPPLELRMSDGNVIAHRSTPPRDGAPTFVWLGGFHSDMTGTKAQALHAWARATGHGFLRFDHFGHGASSGRFDDGDVTRWAGDAVAVIDALTAGPLILVGSSMGGWLALLAARARRSRVAALCLIAPAPDFTEDLIWAELDAAARDRILREGAWMRPSAYGEDPYPITRRLIEDGRKHLLLRAPIAFDGPVRILHGQADPDVPWRRSLTLAERLTSADVRVTLVKSGDHRLSTPEDLRLLEEACRELAARVSADAPGP